MTKIEYNLKLLNIYADFGFLNKLFKISLQYILALQFSQIMSYLGANPTLSGKMRHVYIHPRWHVVLLILKLVTETLIRHPGVMGVRGVRGGSGVSGVSSVSHTQVTPVVTPRPGSFYLQTWDSPVSLHVVTSQ